MYKSKQGNKMQMISNSKPPKTTQNTHATKKQFQWDYNRAKGIHIPGDNSS